MTLMEGATVPLSGEEVRAEFEQRPLDQEMTDYLRYNAPRYAWMLGRIEALLGDVRDRWPGEKIRVLDVAKSFQTELITRLVPDGRVDDLGYDDPRFEGDRRGAHIEYDLNHVRNRESWPQLEAYHLIVIAEVIEHLNVGPVSLLSFLASGLVPGGYLMVQTPNAVALHKRVRMLLGRPDIGPPDERSDGVAHLHEYTARELRAAGEEAGLTVARIDTANYFGTKPAARAYNALGRVLPASLRHGLAVTFQAR
jgi:Methyltransferase domain